MRTHVINDETTTTPASCAIHGALVLASNTAESMKRFFVLRLSFGLLALAGATLLAAAPPVGIQSHHLLLVTTDGLRWQELFTGADEKLLNKESGVADLEACRRDFWRDTPEARRAALMPYFWSVIAKQGQVFGNQHRGSVARVTNGRNFSYPGYQEILAGFPDERINSNAKTPNPNVTMLEWLNQKPQYRGRMAAFCSWDVFPFIINAQRSDVFVNAGWEPMPRPMPGKKLNDAQKALNRIIVEAAPTLYHGSRLDALTFNLALEYLRVHKPRVLYLAFDETDNFAHDGKYEHYLRAAQRVDSYLKTLWETVQSLREYRGRTSLVITTDHGRGDAPTGWKNHGANVAGAEFIWIAILGPDTPALGERANVPEVTQSQVAATAAALLGENYAGAVRLAGKPIPFTVPTR